MKKEVKADEKCIEVNNDGKERPSFIYYKDWAKILLEMPPELRLKIDDAIKKYVLFGELPEDESVKFSMFNIVKEQIDRDNRHYIEVCLKRQKAAKKQWLQLSEAISEHLQDN